MTTHHTHRSTGRSVDPGHLEALGKHAASLLGSGVDSLTEAVVQTIGHEKLNSEQIRRVVEYANIEAFNKKFAALSGQLRSVHIDGGPADPVQVLQDLNDCARPREVTIDTLEYTMPPEHGSKISSFMPDTSRTPRGVVGDIRALHQKLAAAYDEIIQNTEAARGSMNETLEELSGLVKQASLQGAAAQDILDAWNKIDPEMAKLAFSKTRSFMGSSTKVAGRSLRLDSAVVETFAEFAKTAQSYAAHSEALSRVESELERTESWLNHNGG